MPRPVQPSPDSLGDAGHGSFSVHLDVFEGPFDLLLGLIAKHRLDITEVSLSAVTDEFLAYLKALAPADDLDQTTDFLVVAATLLDLKAARLLPAGDVEDAEDLALLEARDLLFARLLQYRAFKRVAAALRDRFEGQARRYPRSVGLDPRFAGLLPEVLIALGPADFADLAARALAPRDAPALSLAHLHAPRVSVKEQAGLLVLALRRAQTTTFRALVADAPDVLTRVARFLALLELFRAGLVGLDQMTAMGELHVRWAGHDQPHGDGGPGWGSEFDEPADGDGDSDGDSDGDR